MNNAMTDEELEQARAWAETAEPYPVKRGFLTLLAEIERLRAIEAAIREDCWSDRDPHGTFERYLNAGSKR